MTFYRVTYRDADGHRTERVVQAEHVVETAGVTTFSGPGPGGASSVGTVVWRVRTNRVESSYDLALGSDRSGD